MSQSINISGNKYGRLTALYLHHKDRNHKEYWMCQCVCGNAKIARKDGLKIGDYKSCGCLFPGKETVYCSECEKEIQRYKLQIRSVMFCSHKCKSEWYKKNMAGENGLNYSGGKIVKVCNICGEEFEVFPKDKKQKYCSSQCYGKYLSTLRGDQTPRYKGAEYYQQERKSIEYADWRKKVFERDGYKCRKCDSNGELNAHHIKPFASNEELRYNIDNGITFCKEHHDEFHLLFGKVNIGMEECEEYIKNTNEFVSPGSREETVK